MTEDERQAVMDGLENRAKRLEAEFYAMRENS